MTNTRVRQFTAIGFGVALIVGVPAPGHTQTFISPLVGFNFGGDAGCPSVTNCEDKRTNVGVALGRMGNVFGIEEEVSYTKDFFGTAPTFSSNVLTVMTNVMVVPDLGPIRPYALAGLGLMRTRIEVMPATTGESSTNSMGWNVGGGLMILFAPHVGVRGDIRYFHAFKDLGILGFTISDQKLDFGRAAGALVLTF